MSASPAVNPVNVIQTVAPVARQGDNAAPDVPFNQVLSREIADRRGAGRDGGGQAQPNVPASAQAPAAGKAKDSDDAKAVAAKQTDEGAQTVDAASAEMLALLNSMVQAAGMASAPADAPPADATAPAIASDRTAVALAAADPSQAAVKTDAAALIDVPAEPALNPPGADVPAQASQKSAADTAPLPSAVNQAPPALAAAVARQSGAPSTPELKAAPQAAAAGQPREAAASKSDAAPNPLAPSAAIDKPAVQTIAAAPADPAVKPASAHAGAKEPAATPVETASEPAVKQAAAKAPEVAKNDSAMRALEPAAANARDTAAAAPNPSPSAIGVQVQQAAAPALAAAAGHASDKLSPRVGTPAWDQALGQKVVWMVAGGVQSASLTLNPPDLGPLQVVLNVSNSHADASFIAPHAETRQALEASMPRLREMLADSGIQLGQSTVSAGTQQNQYSGPSGQPQPGGRDFSQATPVADAASVTPRPAVTRASANGLVDTFA